MVLSVNISRISFISIFLVLFSISFVSAELDFGYDADNSPKVIIGEVTTGVGGNTYIDNTTNTYYSNNFDQDLNTTDDVTFNDIESTGWFRGLFNWTTLTNWLSFDGGTLNFNESKLNTTIADYTSNLSSSGDYVSKTGDNMTGNLNLTNGANVTANDFIIPEMEGNIDYSINHFFKDTTSAGRISGGEIVDNGGIEVIVTAGEGLLRDLDDDHSQVRGYMWDNSSAITVPTDSIMYFGIDLNGGSPIVVNYTSDDNFDLDTSFPLGTVINQKGEIYILNNPWWVGDGLTNVIERFQGEGWLTRDKEVGGLIIGVTGTRNPTLTAGTLWSRLTEHMIPVFDASDGDTFDTYYRDGAGGFNEIADQSQYNITHWDDGTGTLNDIGNNQYATLWVWINVGSNKISLMYPQMTYPSSASAEAEEVPSTYPAMWYKGGVIAGRIIIQEGDDTPVEVQSAFTQVFTAAQAADHGNLAGLTDDDHAQYLLTNGSRALSGNWNTGTFEITMNGINLSQWSFNQSDLEYNFNQSDYDTFGQWWFNQSDIDFEYNFNQSDLPNLEYLFNQSDLDLVYAPISVTGSNWNVSGTNIFPDSLGYSVGIGSPNDALSPFAVGTTNYGNSESSLNLISKFQGTTDTLMIGQYDADGESLYLQTVFTTNYSEKRKLLINPDGGRVGIGTTSPTRTLQVAGIITTTDNDVNIASEVDVDGSETFWIYGDDSNQYARKGYFGIRDNGALRVGFEMLENNSGKVGEFLGLKTDNIMRFYIDEDGNVGIGTTSPQQELNVVGDTNTTGDMFVGDDLFVTDRVGIGTSSPIDSVQIGDGTSVDNLRLFSANSQVLGSGLAFVEGSESGFGIRHNTDGNKLSFTYGNTNYYDSVAMTILRSNGNVGIGTTSPTHELNVVGSANITKNLTIHGTEILFGDEHTLSNDVWDNFIISSSSGKDIVFQSSDDIYFKVGGTGSTEFYIDGAGEVGIGTTTPAQPLNVVGDTNITGDLFVGDDLFVEDDSFVKGILTVSEGISTSKIASGGGIGSYGVYATGNVSSSGSVGAGIFSAGGSVSGSLGIGGVFTGRGGGYNWGIIASNVTNVYPSSGQGTGWFNGGVQINGDLDVSNDITTTGDLVAESNNWGSSSYSKTIGASTSCNDGDYVVGIGGAGTTIICRSL